MRVDSNKKTRLRWTTVVLLGVAGVLFGILALPGHPAKYSDWQGNIIKVYEHGWPYVWMTRVVIVDAITGNPVSECPSDARKALVKICPRIGKWRSFENPLQPNQKWKQPVNKKRKAFFKVAAPIPGREHWSVKGHFHFLNAAGIASNLAAMLIGLFIFTWAFESRSNRRGSLLRLSLQEMFIGVTLFALLVAAPERIRTSYEKDKTLRNEIDSNQESTWVRNRAPLWISRMIGLGNCEIFERTDAVFIDELNLFGVEEHFFRQLNLLQPSILSVDLVHPETIELLQQHRRVNTIRIWVGFQGCGSISGGGDFERIMQARSRRKEVEFQRIAGMLDLSFLKNHRRLRRLIIQYRYESEERKPTPYSEFVEKVNQTNLERLCLRGLDLRSLQLENLVGLNELRLENCYVSKPSLKRMIESSKVRHVIVDGKVAK